MTYNYSEAIAMILSLLGLMRVSMHTAHKHNEITSKVEL